MSFTNVVGEISMLIGTLNNVSRSGNKTIRTATATETATETETKALIAIIIGKHIKNNIISNEDKNDDDNKYNIININNINVNIKKKK